VIEGTRTIQEHQLRRNVKRFPGGLVSKAHRLVNHSTLGLRVIKKKIADSLCVQEWESDHASYDPDTGGLIHGRTSTLRIRGILAYTDTTS